MKELYLNMHFRLTPEHNKIPLNKNWQKVTTFDSDHKGNYGWVLQDNHLVIDVDRQNGGLESYERLSKTLNMTLEPTVFTPSGGFHIYLIKPFGVKINKLLKDFEGIDFLSKGCKATIAGSLHKNTIYNFANLDKKLFMQKTPENLLDLLSRGKQQVNAEMHQLIGNGTTHTPDEIKALLSILNHDMPNSEWVKVGMALKRWDKDKGLNIWEEWSKGGNTYKPYETEKRWGSFDLMAGDSKISMATVERMVKIELLDNINNWVIQASEYEIESNLSDKIQGLNINDLDISNLSKLLQNRLKEVSGTKPPIATIRSMIKDITDNDDLAIPLDDNLDAPDWCNEWVYVLSHTAYVKVSNLLTTKTEGFNLLNTQFVEANKKGERMLAAKYVAVNGYMRVVSYMSYLPHIKEALTVIDGEKVLNTFNHTIKPKPAKTYTEDGKRAIAQINTHATLICNTETDARVLIQYLAFMVQFPGKKMLWTPLIQGLQGIGKSFFGTLLRCVLGHKNVGTVSPDKVIGSYNGWATGVMVNVLEELRISGKNRDSVANIIKPLITDDYIQIDEKYVRSFTTTNTTNYIAFTNYKDALPMTEGDRRWWLIYCNLERLSDISSKVDKDFKIYFDELFTNLKAYSTEVLKWLLEYKISEEFMNMKQAPMNQHKLSAIATEKANFEFREDFEDIIKKGGQFFNEACISSSDLFTAAKIAMPELVLVQGKSRNLMLKALGYMQHANQIRISNQIKRIWTKRTMSNDEVKNEFKKMELNYLERQKVDLSSI